MRSLRKTRGSKELRLWVSEQTAERLVAICRKYPYTNMGDLLHEMVSREFSRMEKNP